MTHDDARLLLSAVSDGEAARTPELDAHLAGCPDCTRYAADLARVATLTAALPRPTAPKDLPHRVTRRITRRRWAFRLAPALAAATAAAVVALTLPGPGTSLFPLPPAAAAEPLLRVRTLYVERTVTAGEVVSREKIWWRAPASVRIERTVTGPEGKYFETVVEGPGFRFEHGMTTTGPPPSITLPEPLSPTVQLLGEPRGAGPVVAGRRTTRYDVSVGGDVRTALVAEGLTLGGTDSLVVSKESPGTSKTTQVLRVNEPIDDALLARPPSSESDAGFRGRALDRLRIEPDALPEGFAVTTAGSGPDGEAYLLTNGSLPVLVREGGISVEPTSEVRTVERGATAYQVTVDLYAPPAVQVDTGRGVVTVSAPLPVESLVDLAVALYGLE